MASRRAGFLLVRRLAHFTGWGSYAQLRPRNFSEPAKQEINMRVTQDGITWHEPPYTEEDAIYRAVAAGPMRILHAPKVQPAPAPLLPQKRED